MPALMIQAPDQASPALHAALYAEWQKFRDGTAPVDPEYIPPFILASWERCRESGITTEANSIVRVDALLLEQAQRLNSDLLCSARSIMDKLFSVVRATRCSISLTDGSGLVLHTLRSEGDGPDVLPGQIATEAVSGTNGIGTCLVERKTVTIIGAQHYCARHHVWSYRIPHPLRRRHACRRPQCFHRPGILSSAYAGHGGGFGPRHRGTAPPAGRSRQAACDHGSAGRGHP
ncbi:MAG: GAF domain-containing protein [Bilophila wadsworthia]